MQRSEAAGRRINRERLEILDTLERWLETPMLVLGFVWLALLIVEFVWGLSSILEIVGTIIWIIFVLDFVLKFVLAPQKLKYLKKNWLTVVALVIPALRVFRIFRVVRLLQTVRIARGLRLVRILTSLNRGMKSLGASMGRRGFSYVIALSIVVCLAGAAGMLAFENEVPNGLDSYGKSLWWTAMLLTSIGSDYFPQTSEGRILCFLLALYGFTVFGYITATLASFFVERDAANKNAETVGTKEISALRCEIAELRNEIRSLSQPKAE